MKVPPQLFRPSRPEDLAPANPYDGILTHPELHVQTVRYTLERYLAVF